MERLTDEKIIAADTSAVSIEDIVKHVYAEQCHEDRLKQGRAIADAQLTQDKADCQKEVEQAIRREAQTIGEAVCCLVGNVMIDNMDKGKELGDFLKPIFKMCRVHAGLDNDKNWQNPQQVVDKVEQARKEERERILTWLDSKKEGIYSEPQGIMIKFTMLHTEWLKLWQALKGGKK